ADHRELEPVSDALDELARVEPLLAQVVDLKFFCGFSFGEIALMRGVSERTVQRDWEKARIYLHRTLSTSLEYPVARPARLRPGYSASGRSSPHHEQDAEGPGRRVSQLRSGACASACSISLQSPRVRPALRRSETASTSHSLRIGSATTGTGSPSI